MNISEDKLRWRVCQVKAIIPFKRAEASAFARTISSTRSYADLKLDYIELSALAKARAPGSGGFLYLLAGPTVSFEVRCTTDLTYSLGGDTVEPQLGRDYSDVPCSERDHGIGAANTEAVEFAVAGGIGTEFPVGASTRVSVELLYTLGLVSVLDDSRNRAITLRAGVSLPIG